MLLDQDVKLLGTVPADLLGNFKTELEKIQEWMHSDFDRHGDILKSRTVIIPCGLRPEPYQPETQQIMSIRQGFEPIRNWISYTFENYLLLKVEINYLPPKTVLPYHIDHCWFHEFSSRIHIPITSNDKCVWLAFDRQYSMKVGSYYEVNNRIKHSFWNNGDSGRVHIVFDIIHPDVYHQALATNIDINASTIDPGVTDPKEILGDQVD